LPHPGDLESEHDFRYYKRAQMCGEVAVLTLCEFVYVKWLYDQFPELGSWIEGRCAVPLLGRALAGKTTTQIALRLDEFLHKGFVSGWVRGDEQARAFADYYTPMLERDRNMIDQCWAAMRAEPETVARMLAEAPKARFADTLNGMELTCWMIADFEHLLSSAPDPDWALVTWNRTRRSTLVLPTGWPGA
jgi:hypothetical protein